MATDYKEQAQSDNGKDIVGFTEDELRLNSTDWKKLISQKRRRLATDVAKWSNVWETWDLWSSPMSDDNRSIIRYGHYLGWFSALESDEQMPK